MGFLNLVEAIYKNPMDPIIHSGERLNIFLLGYDTAVVVHM